MKNRVFFGLMGMFAAVALLLGGCQVENSSSVQDSSSLPVSSSLPDASAPPVSDASEIVLGSDYFRSLTTEKVNWVLEGYRDGTLPEEIIYHSDANTVLESPPKDAVLPESVTVEDLVFGDETSELYGHVQKAVLELMPEEYLMQVWVVIGNQSVSDPIEPFVIGVHFKDLRYGEPLAWAPGNEPDPVEPATVGEVTFTEIVSDRTYADADFTGVALGEVGAFSGNLQWDKSGDFLWINYGGGHAMYTYDIATDGTLVQEYPNAEYSDFNSAYITLSDEEMLAENTALFAAFQQALADSGLPV